MEKILVTGALGQLGTELIPELHKKFGAEQVFATDIHLPVQEAFGGNFISLDVLNKNRYKNYSG